MTGEVVDGATTAREVGNGLIILGLILLVVYVAFVLLPPSLYTEYTRRVETELSVAPALVLLFGVLIVIGLVLRSLSRAPEEVLEGDSEE